MAQMPELVIAGTSFVLTGRMWKDRVDIITDITRAGGRVSGSMRKGCILVMASASWMRGVAGRWHTQGTATAKADKAIEMGAVVYHEKMLRDALFSPNGRARALRVHNMRRNETTGIVAVQTSSTMRKSEGAAVALEKRQMAEARALAGPTPEWNDELQAKLDANLQETSELLASF